MDEGTEGGTWLSPDQVPDVLSLTPVYIEWYFWVSVSVLFCAVIILSLSCLLCCRTTAKPRNLEVVQLSEPEPTCPGTVLAPEGIIQPDVSFYTQVHTCHGHLVSEWSPTPLRPLRPAYLPPQPISTIRLPYFNTQLSVPPGYVIPGEPK